MTADGGESNGRGPDAEVEEGLAAALGSPYDPKKRAVGKEEEVEGAGRRIRDDSSEKKTVPDSDDLIVDSPDSGVGGFCLLEESFPLDDESVLQVIAVSAVTATTEETEEECPVEGCEPKDEKDKGRKLIMGNGGVHKDQDAAVLLSSEMKAAAANVTSDAAVSEKAKASGHVETEKLKNFGNEDSGGTGELDADRETESRAGIIVESSEFVHLGEKEGKAEMNGQVEPANDQGHLKEGSSIIAPATASPLRSEQGLETVELGEHLGVQSSVSEADHVKETVSVVGAHEPTPICTSSDTDVNQANSPSTDGAQRERIVNIDEVSNSAPGEDITYKAPNSTFSATDDGSTVVDKQESQKREADGDEDSNSTRGEDTANKAGNDTAVASETGRQAEEKQADAIDTASSSDHTKADVAAMKEEKLEINDHKQSESSRVLVEEEGQKQVSDIKSEQEQEPEQQLDAATADSEKLELATEVVRSVNQPQQQDISKSDMNDEANPSGADDASNANACSEDGDEVRSTPTVSKRTYANVVASGSQSYSRNHLTKFGHVAANLNAVSVAKPGSFFTTRALGFAHDANFTEFRQTQQLGDKKRMEDAMIYGFQKHTVEKVPCLQNNYHESKKQYAECSKQSILKMDTFDGRSLGTNKKAPSIQVQSVRGVQQVTHVASEVKQESSDLMDSGPFLPVAQKKAEPRKFSEATPKEPTKAIVAAEPNDESTDGFVKVRSRNRRSEKSIRKAEERAIKEELKKERTAAELQEKLRLEQIAKAREAEERKKRQAEKAQLRAGQRAQKEAELKDKKRTKKNKKKALAAADKTEDCDDDASVLPTFEKNPTKIVDGPHVSAATSWKRPKKFKRMEPLPLPLRNRRNRRMRTWMWALLIALVVVALFFAGDYISTSISKLPSFGFAGDYISTSTSKLPSFGF